MRAKDVLALLGITQPTLGDYVKRGLIKATTLPSGRKEYDEESVYMFLNRGVPRKNYVYARVSTTNQKESLENQVNLLLSYCLTNGIQVGGVFKDIASGISFENRSGFFQLLDIVLAHKADKVVVTYKDRLSRVGFELFKTLFEKFGTQIIVISEVGSSKLDSEEVVEEIVPLLQCYSTKPYSRRQVARLKEVLKDESLD